LLVSNKFGSKSQFTIVLVWLTFTIAAFGYAITDKLVSFDNSQKLQGIEHQQLATSIKPYIEPLLNNKGTTVLHFSQDNCDCQKTSDRHIQEIDQIANKNAFNVINVVISEHDIIPATPSVAIVDEGGAVVYFGPYGQGLACSQTFGYAQTILNNFLKGYSANIIIKEAKGCYCQL
jgi:hypothetical protein